MSRGLHGAVARRHRVGSAALLALGLVAGCERIEVDYEARDAELSKLDIAGAPLAPTAGPWACVHDAGTGLTWEVKTGDEGVHHGGWTFTWRDPSWPRQAQGTCPPALFDSCDTAQLVARTNRERLCGYDDWRLPTAAELETLLDLRVPKPGPRVIGCYFPYTQRGSYWTSDRAEPVGRQRGRGYASIDFATGTSRGLLFNRSLYVRLVRGPMRPLKSAAQD